MAKLILQIEFVVGAISGSLWRLFVLEIVLIKVAVISFFARRRLSDVFVGYFVLGLSLLCWALHLLTVEIMWA